MALEDTALWSEVQAVLYGTTQYRYYHWTIEVVANGVTYTSSKVVSIDLERQYDKNYSDKVMVIATFPKGTYQHLIVPFKDNLLCTLKGTPIGATSTQPDLSVPLPVQQMRGTLVDNASEIMEGNDPNVQDVTSANMIGVQYARIQLVDLTLEQVRMKGVGGIYRQTTPANVLKTVMVTSLKDLKLGADATPAGVDMVDPDNTTARDHVVIPHTTSFLDLPDNIHNNCGGVYSTGFGFYLQNAMWYVYPSYNIKRFDTAKKTITFINLPKNRFPESERTYRTTPNQTIVLVTGDTKSTDNTEGTILNKGNGVRYTDANTIVNGGFGTAQNNVFQVQRAKNNSEFNVEPRSTGLNNIPVSPDRATANGYTQMSKMALTGGRHMQITWENSNPALITPGMPCKYVYTVNDQTLEAEGVVLGSHTFITMQGKGLADSRHLSKTVVTLFIDKSTPWAANEPTADTSLMTSTSTNTAA
jgi:hypothetical protein